jgi:hypothetical protein
MALMAATAGFAHLIAGFDNRGLTARMRALLDPGYSSRHATYDLRRLRRKQIITRIPGTHRYQLTAAGRAVAVLFTKAYGRILGPGLASSIPSSRPDWPSAARSLSPGRTCYANSTVSSITRSPQPEY